MLFQYWVQQSWVQRSFSVAFLQLSHYRSRLYLVWGFVLRMNSPNPCQLNFEWYWKNSNPNKSKQRKNPTNTFVQNLTWTCIKLELLYFEITTH